MESEAVYFPAVNWYPNALVTGQNGTAVYGCPSKGLAFLQTLYPSSTSLLNDITFDIHLQTHAHLERVISVDLNPLWPEKKTFISAGQDNHVKQWVIESMDGAQNFKPISAHNDFALENEDIISAAYLNNQIVMSVGVRGCIVKWDLESNVTKKNKNLLKQLKPSCLSCSPHNNNLVAVGTKQGIVVIFDAVTFKIVYKVRGHTNEVYSLSWCPKFTVSVEKAISPLAQRLKDIQSGKRIPIIGTNVINDGDVQVREQIGDNSLVEKLDLTPNSSKLNVTCSSIVEDPSEIVQEDDLFDVYKEPELEEFGHKKYQPEDILVKIKAEKSESEDFLAECAQLKEQIVNAVSSEVDDLSNDLGETSLVDRVNAMTEKLNLSDAEGDVQVDTDNEAKVTCENLLASCDKFGKIFVWNNNGAMMASTSVPRNKKQQHQPICSNVIHWMKPDCLLMSDGNSNLLAGNPLELDCKNNFKYEVLHSVHKKGLYAITSTAPRVFDDDSSPNDDFTVWTVGINKTVTLYSYGQGKVIAAYPTIGGKAYQIAPCPNDALKYAIACGDGTVKLLEFEKGSDDRLKHSKFTTYWQNVQGKALNAAWHPTKENLLAFATAEGRVGLIDTSGKGEKPASLLRMVMGKGVYSISWGEGMNLYACGGDKLVVYNAASLDADPEQLHLSCEGSRLLACECSWSERGLAVGDKGGAVAIFTKQSPHTYVAVSYPFKKLIQCIAWHPHSMVTTDSESPFRNCLAACSTANDIVLIKLNQNGESTGLEIMYRLNGHISQVNKLIWSPNNDNLLMSTSEDTTIRLWECDQSNGTNYGNAIVGSGSTLCASFSTEDSDIIFYGSADHTLGVISLEKIRGAQVTVKSRGKKTKSAKTTVALATSETDVKKNIDIEIAKEAENELRYADDESQIAVTEQNPEKYKRGYMLPLTTKYQNINSVRGCYQMLIDRGLLTNDELELEETNEINLNYLKLYGTPEEVGQLLDMEQEYLLENKFDAWCCVGVLRGDLQNVIQTAAQRDLLTPFLLSLAPAVSHKFWKDAVGLYAQQCERLAARNTQETTGTRYGGALIRRALCLLCVSGDAGCSALAAAGAIREALIAASLRRLPSKQYLEKLVEYSIACGHFTNAAECYISMGDLPMAAKTLGRLSSRDHLTLASKIARNEGMQAFADSTDSKIQNLNGALVNEKEFLPSLENIAVQLERKWNNMKMFLSRTEKS